MRVLICILFGLGFSLAHAAPKDGDYLIKLDPSKAQAFKMRAMSFLPAATKMQDLEFDGWVQVQVPPAKIGSLGVKVANALSNMPGVLYVQPNYKIRLLDQPGMAALKAKVAFYRAQNPGVTADDCPIPIPGLCDGDSGGGGGGGTPTQDNPEIPAAPRPSTGNDPLFSNQWGMLDIGVEKAWNKSKGRNNVVVAVIDTGIDYLHEDLAENLWRNPGEIGTDAQGRDKSKNGVDDDGNGYIDDVIGWDFVSNDNKPYDLASSGLDLILNGGNPGHGTHCAGNVAARGFNGKGVAGVAPNVSIMALRFLSEKGQGTTAGAIQAIAYALRNGAHVTSNSWGSEGEDDSEAAENQALREAIQASQNRGVLFIAAAGNGHNGAGYNNDSDSRPGYPASYPHDIIVSVAALDVNNNLGSFSNWGPRSVDIGAPGVKVYSTTVGSHYSDTVANFLGQQITWDGTSMATPHVAGAAALYLSFHPNASWQEVKQALLDSAKPVDSLRGKVVSGGKLNVEALLDR